MATTTENRPTAAGTTRAATGGQSDADGASAAARRAPAEILETADRGDGLLVTRYRWRSEGGTHADGSPMEAHSGEAWASGPVTPLSREVLEDRWAGLLRRRDATKLQRRLDSVLADLADGLTRRDVYSENAVIDEEVVGLDVAMGMDGLQDVIRDWMLERAAKVAVR